MDYTINLTWDAEAGVWVAINNEIPIALEAESVDELMKRVRLAIPEMIELNNMPEPRSIYFLAEVSNNAVYA